LLEVDGDTGEIIDEIGLLEEDGTYEVKIRDLSFEPGTDILFGVGKQADGGSADFDNENALFIIDISDAEEIEFVGDFDTVDPIKGLAFDPTDGTLYGVNCKLFTIDPTDADILSETALDRCYDGLGIDADGQIFGTTDGRSRDSLHLIDPVDGSDVTVAGVGENPSDVDFFPAPEREPSPRNGGGAHESPTIGKNYAGTNQIVTNGMGIDGQFWTVTQPFHEEMKLLQLLTGPHTISNTIFCNEGVQECNYVGIAFTTKDFDFNDPVMKVEAQKTGGEWIISWYDPQDFIQDPDDDIPGVITFTADIEGDFLLTSFTIVFKNKDTGELVIGIQVRDEERGVRTFWFNEGVEFIDSDAYPSIETEFENPLEIDSLCLNEDPTYRNSCAFDKVRDWATNNAEYLLEDIQNGNYIYDKYVRDKYYN